MRNYITFAGQDLRQFGVYISGEGTYSAPQREYQQIAVPGRNRDLLIDGKRYGNIQIVYPAFIYSNLKQNLAGLRAFLLSQTGYQRLTDTYHTGEFRQACYAGPFEPEVTAKGDAGSFELVFNCGPQRYLGSGETATTLTADGTVTNPTRFNAKPLLRVRGNGTVGIGAFSFTVASNSNNYTDIDCEMLDCFRGSANRNNYVTFTNHEFPELVPGSNGITLGTGITSVRITPRWWTV